MSTEVQRVFNFSAGPAVLPEPVLEQIQAEMLSLPGVGCSLLEISHRSKEFLAIHEAAKADLTELLGIPSNYKILFLQGGSRLQFSMIPMNLLGKDQTADYLITGSWSKYALAEAEKEGKINVAWDGKADNYSRLPAPGEATLNDDAAYAYYASNETIQGVQFPTEPVTKAPLVCDASSDFMCRPLPIDQYGILYACAQKNAGPAGVTVLIIRDDLLERSRDELPGYLNFKLHAENDSLWNTPPTFGIYVVGLVAKWLKNEVGGLDKMLERNRLKSSMLYDVIDNSNGFYEGHAQPDCRSLMNVTFRLPNETLEKAFNDESEKQQLASLKGHRSVGGIRASIYNAMPVEGVEALAQFMRDFASRNG
ncbi:3-phosphoserine/phosphohydroxythreonine transaminase [Lignipirellula cremea]|uniref:Phosphoserine aminotransferase n=1 Tax=Lignipirellula cremea TaxID=2528010 RepID=A0A518DP95_9BACT|nr:3-phosphoserine/phosphohydroxythreonine transaminase [Lignipirellula cremea]QDU93667.1 Phosphoserine aminotransferase [Lignipirellula cremea]